MHKSIFLISLISCLTVNILIVLPVAVQRLQPAADYYQRYKQDVANAFINHMHHPYIYLVNPALLKKPE